MNKPELVVIMKGGRKQRNVRGAILATQDAPPFAEDRDGYHLRWWGPEHPVSRKMRELVSIEDDGDGTQMKIGWMWFDNDPKRTLEEKVLRAVEQYHAKFKRWPKKCYVNQRAVDGDGFTCGRVEVVAAPNVLPHHFWLGSGNGAL